MKDGSRQHLIKFCVARPRCDTVVSLTQVNGRIVWMTFLLAKCLQNCPLLAMDIEIHQRMSRDSIKYDFKPGVQANNDLYVMIGIYIGCIISVRYSQVPPNPTISIFREKNMKKGQNNYFFLHTTGIQTAEKTHNKKQGGRKLQNSHLMRRYG